MLWVKYRRAGECLANKVAPFFFNKNIAILVRFVILFICLPSQSLRDSSPELRAKVSTRITRFTHGAIFFKTMLTCQLGNPFFL